MSLVNLDYNGNHSAYTTVKITSWRGDILHCIALNILMKYCTKYIILMLHSWKILVNTLVSESHCSWRDQMLYYVVFNIDHSIIQAVKYSNYYPILLPISLYRMELWYNYKTKVTINTLTTVNLYCSW